MQLKYKALALITVLVAVGFFASNFVVRAGDNGFSISGYQTLLNGKPFSGVLFDLYPNYRPRIVGFYWAGLREGTFYDWYEDGTLWKSQPYDHGQQHGVVKIWYPDGRVKYRAQFDHDLPDGEIWGWHPNGQVSDYNLFRQGKEVTHKSWISDGKPYYNYVYQDGKKLGVRGGDFCKILNRKRN